MITNVVRKLDSSYPAPADRSRIENYLGTTKARRSAVAELRRVTTAVIDKVIARMKATYPQFAGMHQHGFEKGHRDLVLLTNMAGNSMFLGEHETLDETFTHWYKTILKSVHVSPQFMQDTFSYWLAELETQLSAEAYGLLRPHAEHLAEMLSNLPVPVRDEIGERRRPTL